MSVAQSPGDRSLAVLLACAACQSIVLPVLSEGSYGLTASLDH